MLQLISKIIMWSLCIFYSALAAFQLIILYITKFSTQPWKPKERTNPPACLSDPKYGVHQFAEVNVSVSEILENFHDLKSSIRIFGILSQGIRLHYVEAGDRKKPLMLFVHGFPEFWFCWRHQITEFSKDFW